MSVSEKLKALESDTVKLRHAATSKIDQESEWIVAPCSDLAARLIIALPQIAAMTSAAEKLDDEYEKWRQDASDGMYALWSEHALQDALYTSRLALAALEEILS